MMKLTEKMLRLSFLFFVLFPLELRAADFRAVNGDYVLEYPRDRGAHPEFETEWWYFTGHLKPATEAEFRFGFELVFFRVGLAESEPSKSAWNSSAIFLAHFAITDDKANVFFSSERTKRGSFGDAGADVERLNVWNGDWKVEEEDGIFLLSAEEDGYSLSLELRSKGPEILHGKNGFSKKGPSAGQASYYASLPRLEGSGHMRTPRESKRIETASVWMDQEFTSSETAYKKIAWDWFALQLRDGESFMLYQLRDEKGEKTEFSAGTFISKDGKSEHLRADEFSVQVLSSWTSKKSGIRYPALWRLSVPKYSRVFIISPTVPDQELLTASSTGVRYWEGRAKVSENGIFAGNAYVELVGYQ